MTTLEKTPFTNHLIIGFLLISSTSHSDAFVTSTVQTAVTRFP